MQSCELIGIMNWSNFWLILNIYINRYAREHVMYRALKSLWIRYDTIQVNKWDHKEREKTKPRWAVMFICIQKTETYMNVCVCVCMHMGLTKPYINSTLFNKHQMQGAQRDHTQYMWNMECVWSSHEGTHTKKTHQNNWYMVAQ